MSGSAYPDFVIAGTDDPGFDKIAVAHVLRGILDMSGLRFDAEGGLLPEGY
jgi:hypothetical protein